MFDPTVLFMVFMMLCFAGMAAMFYFILRGLDELSRELRGERSQLVGLMQSMEASLDLLVKSAQISLKLQAAKEHTGQNPPAEPKATPPKAAVAEGFIATVKPEKDLAFLQMKVPSKLEMNSKAKEPANAKGPLALYIDDTK